MSARRVWIGFAAVGILFCLAIIIWPVIHSARVAARLDRSFTNYKHLIFVWETYASDNDQRSCPTTNWNYCLELYYNGGLPPMESVLADEGPVYSYKVGMNDQIGGVNLQLLEGPKIVFAPTTDAGPDALSNISLLPATENRLVVSLTDGTTKTFGGKNLALADWKPVLMAKERT